MSYFKLTHLIYTGINLIFIFTACVAAVCTFLLGTKHLGIVYLYLTSIGIAVMSYWSNASMVEAVTSYIKSEENGGSILAEILNLQFTQLLTNGPGLEIIKNYIVQSFLAYLFLYVYFGPRNPRVDSLIAWSFTLPCHVALFPLPVSNFY